MCWVERVSDDDAVSVLFDALCKLIRNYGGTYRTDDLNIGAVLLQGMIYIMLGIKVFNDRLEYDLDVFHFSVSADYLYVTAADIDLRVIYYAMRF